MLDLTALVVWSQEECSLHINVLEMKAVNLALAAFLPQLSGQSVLMSDNTTVVAYLQHHGGMVSHVLLSPGHQGSVLDQASFGLLDGQIYSEEEDCSGGPNQSSRPGSSQGDLLGV